MKNSFSMETGRGESRVRSRCMPPIGQKVRADRTSALPQPLHRLPAARPREPVAVVADKCLDPCRVCVGVVAQDPADRLSDEELLLISQFENGRGQQGHVGLFLVLQMRQQRGAAPPEVRRVGPGDEAVLKVAFRRINGLMIRPASQSRVSQCEAVRTSSSYIGHDSSL